MDCLSLLLVYCYVLLCVAKICELLKTYDRVEGLMELTPSSNNKYPSSVGTQPSPAINPYNAWSVNSRTAE